MEAVREYFLTMILTGIFASVVQIMLPAGFCKRIAGICGGLLLVITAISPITRLDYDQIAESISRIQIADLEASSGLTIDNKSLISQIIKEQTESYILDKAAEILFAPKTVDVTVCESGDYPVPESVTVCGPYSESQRTRLTAWIERELAIAPEHQEWLWNER